MGEYKQKTLSESDFKVNANQNFKMCYKLVTGDNIISNDKFDNHQKKLLLNVFNSFKTSKPLNLENLTIDKNTQLFIEKLLETDDEEFIKMLLNDFSRGMNTKMREKDNYVTLILNEETLILAHSKMGEQSINTDFNVFERLIDKDNVKFIDWEYIAYRPEFYDLAYFLMFSKK